ncbi:MAG: hypothetical protein IPL36_09765 [Nigerium sp.]|nr:hypothetical protein [Nigerium sp.]
MEDAAPATISAGRGWLALVETNAALAKEDLAAAERYLAIAQSVKASAWDHPLGHPLVGLHEAALRRAAGEYAACVAQSERLVAHVRQAKLTMPHVVAAAELLAEEVRQFADFDGRTPAGAGRFEDLAQRFSLLGYRTSAARALGSAYRAGGRQPTPAQIEDWHTWKWANELAWLGRGRGAPLTHWVLPI